MLSRVRKVNMLKLAVGNKVSTLWKTGLLPAVAHGAAVGGISDSALRSMRATAGMMVGAKPAASLTLALLMAPSPNYDPMYEATIPIVTKYADWLWQGGVQMGRLQRAWQDIGKGMDVWPSWAHDRGPVARCGLHCPD